MAVTLLLSLSAGAGNASAATHPCPGSVRGRSVKAANITVTNLPADACERLIVVSQYLDGDPIPPWKIHKRGSRVTLAYRRERIGFTLVHT